MEKVSEKTIYGYYKTAQLKANKKWRENNPEKWKASNNQSTRDFYERNRQAEQQRALKYYYFKKAAAELRNIDL